MVETVDPIKYEIFRHRLFSILEEGRTTIGMVSGSPAIVEGGECMVSFYDAEGRLILCAGGILFHVTGSRDAILKTIEWYSQDPGIFEGDQFFYNDPYIAGSHIYDMIMVSPIFHRGKLIAWSGSMTHTGDTGGLLRGSSKEIFHEGIRYQGIKLVEKGKMRADVFRSITQQCRDPHYVGLDLKARVASNNVATQRFLALVEAYGADFVTSASDRLMEEGEQLARAKLRSLPDGTWRSRMYRSTTVSVDGKEVVRPYKAMCTLTKKGEHLTFDATGSSPQNEDHRNATYVCSWSKLFEALAGFTFWDLPWNQGMTNPVTLIAPEGSVVNCKYPASCGLGTLVGGFLSGAAMDCIARMMYAGGEREGVNASWRGNFGDGGPYYWYGGRNQYGGIVGQGIYDLFGGGQGATPVRDGNHSGGIAESAQSCISDIEFTEMYFPFLYLSRNHMPDSGGCGKFAGGMTLESVM
ncbi:MAG TPA: hydantoinase B/oxoprolinase family protein, partial [Dehalococcoidia bacterium]|nr:hydantoinase B/oxoprolinase family protein [Dehalococcoidia bacterium]